MISELFKWLLSFFICLILQTTIIPYITIAGVYPDLLLLILALLAFNYGAVSGIYIGFFLGLALDTYSPSFLGQHALAKTIFGAFIGIFNEKVMRTDLIFKLIIIFVGILIHDSLFYGVELIKNDQRLSLIFSELLFRSLPRSLYTLILILLVQFWKSSIKPSIRF